MIMISFDDGLRSKNEYLFLSMLSTECNSTVFV